jgi:hypothetical protein
MAFVLFSVDSWIVLTGVTPVLRNPKSISADYNRTIGAGGNT